MQTTPTQMSGGSFNNHDEGDYRMRIQADDYIKNMDRRYKIAFFSAFIIGIISQGMGLFNKFSVHDDPFYFSDVGATYTSGRWMLDILSIFEERFFGDGPYSLPAFNGFLAIILTSRLCRRSARTTWATS